MAIRYRKQLIKNIILFDQYKKNEIVDENNKIHIVYIPTQFVC